MHMKSGMTRSAAMLLSLLLLLSAATGCGKKTEETTEAKAGLDLGYAVDGVMETEDPEAFQRRLDEMFSQDTSPFVLEYKQTAMSTNGTDFTCYLANAAENTYDMFMTIYGDAAQTDLLYQSQLLRPGTSFSTITLNHALNPGTHTVTVIFTQVENVDGVFTPHNELSVTVEFTVQQE